MRSTRLFRAAAGALGAAALAVSAAVSSPGQGAPAAGVVPSPVAAQAPSKESPSTESPAAAQAPMGTQSVAAQASCPVTMNVVAHEDDDLLFINPSVSEDIAAGRCVVTVFVTAGDAGRPRFYWRGREQGSMDAYAAMAGVPSVWRADAITLAGHAVSRFRLAGARVTLLFLRLPDAHGAPGRAAGTLRHLWLGLVRTLHPLDTNAAYTRPALIGTLTAAMNAFHPSQIRTLDYAGHYSDGDHEDHHTVGYLTLAAQRSYRTRHRIAGYMGYEVAARPANLDAATSEIKLGYFLAYAPHDVRVCQSADACLSNFYAPRFSHHIMTATQ